MSTDSAAKRCRETRPHPTAEPRTTGPPEDYRVSRESCPVARVRVADEFPGLNTTGWFVTRFEDVRALLADPRLVRPDVNDWPPRPAGWPRIEPGLTTLMELEGAEHTRSRRVLADRFGVRAIRGRTGRMREIADELLDDMVRDDGPADLVSGFTDPFPVRTMCALTGIPSSEARSFTAIARALLFSLDLDGEKDVPERLRDLVAGWIERKRREPGDDVLTELLARRDAGELHDHDLINFGRSMVIAGFAFNSLFLANAVLTLLEHPDQLARLRADPGLLPGAVEELLRFPPVLNGNVFLQPTEDISIRDQRIGAGGLVLPVLASANRDESVFRDADRFDITRSHNPHLAFGRGAHNCL